MAKSFWAEAVKTANYVINRSPSTAIGLKTPMEIWNGKPPDYSSLHVFGCTVYAMYNSQERTKLDPKSRKCIFLGYADNVKGYRLWDPTAHKLVVSRDVVFAENELQSEQKHDNTAKETTAVEIEMKSKEDDSLEVEPDKHAPNASNNTDVRRSSRQIITPAWHSNCVMTTNDAYWLLTEEGEPSTFQEVERSSDVSLWMAAMHEEMEALHRTKLGNLFNFLRVEKPSGTNGYTLSNEIVMIK